MAIPASKSPPDPALIAFNRFGLGARPGDRDRIAGGPRGHLKAELRQSDIMAPVDVGFHGTSLLDAAGLPMSPVMADLVRLRDHCGGRFHGCQDRAVVDAHLRRRVDSGLLHLFPQAAPLRVLVPPLQSADATR